MSSVMEPESVPSRISVVLVEEAKVRETECLVSSLVDKDPRLLADVANPASVTVNNGSYNSPCVVGTLSPSDSDSVGPCGTLSPTDSVGLCGTLSPTDSEYVGPVDMCGTPSPSDSVAVGPDGTLSSPDTAGMLFPAVPAGTPSPVGPICSYGTLSPSDFDSVILVDPGGMLPSAGLVGTMVPDVSAELPPPMGHVGTVLPCDEEKGLFPIVPTGELSSVKAVPFPDGRDPVITQLHTDMLVEDCSDIVSRDVIRNGCWAVPEEIGDPAVVAMIGLDAMPRGEGIQLHGVDKCAEWDIRGEFETIKCLFRMP